MAKDSSHDLKVAIVHYHLQRGGVTRVMEVAAEALQSRGASVALIAGESPQTQTQSGVAIDIVPGLLYSEATSQTAGEELAGELRRTAERRLGRAPDLWHVHNHSLGKNLALSDAVHVLALQGDPLLLQIHDFAEDARPTNYRVLESHLGSSGAPEFGRRLYPQAPHVHYAVLNDRDFAFLSNAGVAPAALHLLPNAVSVESTPTSPLATSSSGERLYLYPTRAIRRKNLGEFLLWAAVAEPGERFATTLAPENPRELPRYERWTELARELALPADFAIGADPSVSFPELLESSSATVTTSVAEGFGMAFLEPWLFARPVLGRKLVEITVDFENAGVDLSALYSRLNVPRQWIDMEDLSRRLEAALGASWQAYGRPLDERAQEHALNAMVDDDSVDFGKLDESLQETVIRRLAESKEAASALTPSRLAFHDMPTTVIETNRRLISQRFAASSYGKRLLQVYDQVLSSECRPPQPLDAAKLLDQFLAPERFSLLRT